MGYSISMAKDLQNLIQIHEWEVDEKRRKLGELLRLLDNLEAQSVALEQELLREQAIAENSPEEAGFLYGGYAATVIDRRERIAQSIAQMETAISEAREDQGSGSDGGFLIFWQITLHSCEFPLHVSAQPSSQASLSAPFGNRRSQSTLH